MVQRNIEVSSLVWEELKKEADKRNKNVREFIGELLIDYVKKDENKNIKAIILAAGLSSRLTDLTEDRPKCMIEIKGKTVLQRQVETLRECGIKDILVVRGYKKEAINYSDLKYCYNKNYRRNNILESLMHTESEMDDGFIVLYSDILFNKEVVLKLLEERGDIIATVDKNWLENYQNRYQHPVEEAENVVQEKDNIVKIGKFINPNKAHGEFIGMAKFNKKGAEILKKVYKEAKEKTGNKAFQTAQNIEKAYLTDIFQEIIDKGHQVLSSNIGGGWIELDTREDFERAKKFVK